MSTLLYDLFNLVYPPSCVHCGTELSQAEWFYCFKCEEEAGFIKNYSLVQNQITQALHGRIPVRYAHFLLYFYRNTVAQSILHELKYNNNPDIGRFMGRIHARLLRDEANFTPDDDTVLIPVPLHRKKLRKRGYNQAEEYAKGLADILKIKINSTALVRKKYADTLTKRGRILRWLTLKEAYKLERPQEITGKHCILVDDVFTTGATLERCYHEVKKADIKSISVFTIAFASRI